MPDKRTGRVLTSTWPSRLGGRWQIDSASALGGLYLDDDAGDSLATHAREALNALLRARPNLKYRTGEPVRSVLTSGGKDPAPDRAPSLVWHAQAVGTLLELGYVPSAASVRKHLDVLRMRLLPRNADNPESRDADTRWLLRTRHVSWVLACLSEFPANVVPSRGVPDSVVDAIEAHRAIVRTAFSYLVNSDSSCGWIAMQPGETFWSEHWVRRRRNLLNTVYTVLAICRSCRHGFDIPRQTTWDANVPLEQTIHNFVDAVSIEPTPDGPRTRLKGDWEEPWARDVLPAGVVGLIALALTEYAHLMLELSAPGSIAGRRAERAFTLAGRAAHDLLSRSSEWIDTVDAFSYQGVERRLWFVPTYSVGLRAILDAGAATPNSTVVVRALDAVTRFSRRERSHTGAEYETWGDPTRVLASESLQMEGIDETWHTSIPLAHVDPETCPPTASSIHASVMALASFRRAAHFVDPRRLFRGMAHGQLDDELPDSPFTTVVVSSGDDSGGPSHRGRPREFVLELSAGDAYAERYAAGSRYVAVLFALKRLGSTATDSQLAQEIHAGWPDSTSLPRVPGSVRKAIADLNREVGAVLVARSGANPVVSSIYADVFADEDGLPPAWQSFASRTSVSIGKDAPSD